MKIDSELPNPDEIKKLILIGGSLSVPFKKNWSSWYSEIKLYKNKDYFVVCQDSCGYSYFTAFEEAWRLFVDAYTSKQNLGFWLCLLKRKGLYNPDLIDDEARNKYAIKIKKLVKEIKAEYE